VKATDVHHGDDIMGAGHLVGTYRMGLDAKQSVVTPDQRAHDHANLFLLGSGVFRTSAASNPTLTIASSGAPGIRLSARYDPTPPRFARRSG
jgi:choline dehydrogenase-like flavoprotein